MVPHEPDLPGLLTPRDVAEMLTVSPRTVRRLAASGLLERLRIGHRTVRYRETDVAHLIERLAAGGDGLGQADRIANALGEA
jgi:excisionase family DNA binding protein